MTVLAAIPATLEMDSGFIKRCSDCRVAKLAKNEPVQLDRVSVESETSDTWIPYPFQNP